MTASAGGRDLSQRLSKIETAISRRKTIEFTYYTMERDETEKRKVDPYHLVFRGGQFYLIGHSHERDAVRVFRLSRIQGKVGYASKAEHDFSPPEDFDRRDYGQPRRLAAGRDPGHARRSSSATGSPGWSSATSAPTASCDPAKKADGAPGKGTVFETEYASARELIAWVLRWRQNAQVLAPTSCARRPSSRLDLLRDRHEQRLRAGRDGRAAAARGAAPQPRQRPRRGGDPARALRPPRHPRRDADRVRQSAASACSVADLRQRLELTEEELQRGHRPAQRRQLRRRHLRPLRGNPGRRDRGRLRALRRQLRPPGAAAAAGGEGAGRGDRPLRRPPAPGRPAERPRRRSSRRSATTPPRRGWRSPPAAAATPRWRALVNEAIAGRRVLEIQYYKENEDQFTKRQVEPYRLENGREGWYVECYDLTKEGIRHFKLDRIKEATLSERDLRAAARGRGAGRGRGLDDRRRGADRPGRAGLGLAGAGPLAARGAHRGRGAGRRRGRGRAALRGDLLAGAGDPPRRRRPRRARARRRPRGDRQRGRG